MTVARMRAWAWELPEQLRASSERFQPPAWPPASAYRAAPGFIGGMGGSAAGARLARSLLSGALPASVEVGSDPLLPSWVRADSPVGLISYSGATWEVLSLFDQLEERGAIPWVLASGGELIARAEAAGLAHGRLPGGYPPRAAFGWLLPPILQALAATTGREMVAAARPRLLAAADSLAAERDLWTRGGSLPGRSPEELRDRLAGRRCLFLAAGEATHGLAYRWKTQLEENAKQVAAAPPLPEAAHNEVEGWAALGGAVVVALESPPAAFDPPKVRARRSAAFEAILQIAARSGLDVVRVPAALGDPPDDWTALLSHVLLADHVSVHVAEALGVDPEPVPVLAEVKEAVRRSD